MPKMPPPSVFSVLKAAGLIPKQLVDTKLELSKCGPIPDDVRFILTDEQLKEIAEKRVVLCKEFQKLLEDFYKKNYYRHYTDPNYIKEIARADMAVSHDANGTLWAVENYIKKDKNYMEAARMISGLPSKFIDIYNLYVGYSSVDVRPYFHDLFPDVQPLKIGQ